MQEENSPFKARVGAIYESKNGSHLTFEGFDRGNFVFSFVDETCFSPQAILIEKCGYQQFCEEEGLKEIQAPPKRCDKSPPMFAAWGVGYAH